MITETRGFTRKPPVFSLAEEEKKALRAFFCRYTPGKLTAEQAQDILKTLEEAGIINLMGVLGEAGMDALEVWSIAHDGMPHPMLRAIRRAPAKKPEKEANSPQTKETSR